MLIIDLVLKKKISQEDIETELYEICDREHASCNDNCPVYLLNNSSVPDNANDFEKNRGCDCFKSGKRMADFIKSRAK